MSLFLHQTPNICREPLSGAVGATITHPQRSASHPFLFSLTEKTLATQFCKLQELMVSILNPNQMTLNTDGVSKAAVSPKMVFVSPSTQQGEL